ncbi:hypothetical protein B0H15DRAFT_804460 [Mycena belliarum]|uniref:Uncharacterized protein n=1 Tax=Mycena belliarum TaxID=1033014 RepID=A0AAD6TTW3_9AGAR|nr:hypothetical protein B0H15DRAFT_804460 [Mycena belliae]
MPPSKPQLDAETKKARRQASLQRYAAKLRSKTPTPAQQDGKLAAQKKYRTNHRDAIRNTDALRRASKRKERDSIQTYRKAAAPNQAKNEKRLAGSQCKIPPKPSAKDHNKYWEEWSPSPSESDSESQSGSESDNGGSSAIPSKVFYANVRSETPQVLDCDCLLPAYCPNCTCGCDHMCCLYHHEGESEYRKWMKELTWEENSLPPLKLYSSLRMSGPAGGHVPMNLKAQTWSSSLIAMARVPRFEQGWAPLSPLLCVPDYFHDINHPLTIPEHMANAGSKFFAIFEGDDRGIYFESFQVQEILQKAPETQFVTDNSWIGITTKWRDHCARHHDHFDEWFSLSSRSSSPLGSCSAFDTSPAATPTPSRTPSPDPHPLLSQAIPFYDPPARNPNGAPDSPKKPLKKPLNDLGPPTKSVASRSASSVSSLSSASSGGARRRREPQWAGVKGSPELRFPRPILAEESSWPPFPARLLPEMGLFPPDPTPPHHRRPPVSGPLEQPSALESCARVSAAVEVVPIAEIGDVEAPLATPEEGAPLLLYAVSVHRLLFKKRAEAFKLFEATEGAEVHLASSIEEVDDFFCEADSVSARLWVYAVSGRRTVYKQRATAFKAFMQGASVMFFGQSSEEVESFILKYIED